MSSFYNNTKDDIFPKTLEIRSTCGGFIWQLYHINNLQEAEIISYSSSLNGFQSRMIQDYYETDETFPNWRNECSEELKKVLS